MDADDQKAPASTAPEPELTFAQEFRRYWAKFPDKGFFFVLLAAWCALYQYFGVIAFNASMVRSLFEWMYSVWDYPVMESSHGKLIPFVVVVLLWVKRREMAQAITGWWWPALGLLGVSLLLHLFGYMAQQQRVSMVALFFGAYGLVGLVWGPKTMKASTFPFAMFVFCIPFGPLVENLTLPLRLLATKLTYAICHGGLDIELFRNGTQLMDKTGKINYDVAPACSGIRSFVALLAVTTIFSVLAFKTVWKRAAMIAMTLPLVVFFNVIRLVAIIFASVAINRQAGNLVHYWFGYFSYMMAVVCLLGVAHWLRDKPLTTAA